MDRNQIIGEDNTFEPNIHSLKYADEIARNVLNKQLSSSDSIMSGTSIIIGVTGIIIGILISTGIPINKSFSTYFLILALLLISESLIIALLAIRGKEYQYIFNPRQLWDYTAENELDIMKQVYSNMINSCEINDKYLKQGWTYFRISLFILLIGILSAIIYIIGSIPSK